MPGEHLDAVGELEQAVERVEEPFGALGGADRKVGPGGVADEERVARQHEPRLIAARGVGHGQAAVLGAVAGRVDHAERDRADLDRVTVDHRIARVVDLGQRVDADRDAVLEREPAVPGHMVGVRVRLDRPDDPEPLALGLLEQRLDREGGIDEHARCRLLRLPRGNTRSRDRRSGTGGRSRGDGSTLPRYPSGSERRRKK